MPKGSFYNSDIWKRLRRQKLAANPTCESCHRYPASDVDHIQAINHGGAPTDMANLMSLCHKCHSRKTYYIERLGRKVVTIKDTDPRTGFPMDPNHWWNSGT